MRECPLCGLEIDNTDLTRHFLRDSRLVEFIQGTHRKWKPNDGACSRCLEAFYRELSSPGHVPDEHTDETTVITTPQDLINPSAEPEDCPSLIVIHGNDLGKKINLVSGEMIVGRGETAHVRVNEENVSRQHARIMNFGEEVIIEDLQSTNGTFVNTKKITSHPLQEGDLVLVGNTIMKFVSSSRLEGRYHEEIYRLATIDGLTQVYNKSFFLDRVGDEFRRSRRYRRDLSLMLYDFDHFKNLNDTHGHLVGDEVLKRCASLVMRNMRKEDVIGRYGGEEFGVLLPETPLESAVPLAEKLRRLIAKIPFEHNDKGFHTTISMGVTALGTKMRKVEQLIEAADQALYRAKQDGRNCVRT